MRGMEYKGVSYRSMQKCCDATGASYQKVRRLCRWYMRARHNPALAVAWALGEEEIRFDEQKTSAYFEDMAKAAARGERFKERLVSKAVDQLTGAK